ncbi:MAG: phosphoglycerate kinase, partial [Nanoarchaeota archaeon]
MRLKTLNNLKLNGKKILLRVDLNSDVINGKVVESERIKAHAETIKILLKKKARVVILSHQGSLGKKDCTSLKQHAKILSKHVKIKFVPEVMGKKAWREISSLKNGNAVLLENVRFLKDEFTPSVNNSFVNFMKEIGFDYYVNDAFSILHRNQTSIVSFPKIFPHAAGPVLMNELKNINKIKSKLKNCLFVLGGAKTKDLLPLLNQRVLTTGKLSLVVLKAKGYEITKENGLNNTELKMASKIKKHFNNLEVPIDLALNVNGKRKEISVEELPKKHLVWDIG